MKNQNSLKWIIKNSKGEIPKIFILSISNILLALVATVLALVSKLAIDSAQRAATASSNAEFLHYRNLIIFNCILILVVITSRLLLRVFTQSLTIRVQAKMEMKMRGRLFYSIMMKDYGKINKYHSGELMNRITSEVGPQAAQPRHVVQTGVDRIGDTPARNQCHGKFSVFRTVVAIHKYGQRVESM